MRESSYNCVKHTMVSCLGVSMKHIVGSIAMAAVTLASPSLTAGVLCEGGDTKVVDGYALHTFTTSGTIVVTGSGKVEVLVVGGGGGAGAETAREERM